MSEFIKKIKSPVIVKTVKIVLTILIIASLLLNLFTYIFPIVKHYGNSMTPTLNDGNILITFKTDSFSKGDIVAFYYNNKLLVRRIVATEGDSVTVDIFGDVTVNGEKLKETKSPDGYELPVNNFGFTISDSFGTIDGTQTSLTFIASSVENGGASFQNAASIPSTQSISTRLTNIPGSVLPSTGGMGTTIFYIIGIVLMAGALAFFTLRKRSSANNA